MTALIFHGAVAAILMLRPSTEPLAEPEPYFEMVELPPAAAPAALQPPVAPPPPLPASPLPTPLVPEVAQATAEPSPQPLVPVEVEERLQITRELAATAVSAPAATVAATVATSAPAIEPRPPVPAEEPYKAPDLEAAYRTNPAPAYPMTARRRGIEGVVLLKVALDPSGKPQRVEVSSSSGHTILDEAALQAVRGWRFTPAQRGGRAVGAEVEVPLRFALR